MTNEFVPQEQILSTFKKIHDMLGNEISQEPMLMHVEPVLPVKDIAASVDFWVNMLGFHGQWKWGDPPVHGGVSRNGVFVQFSLDPDSAEKNHQYLWIRVKHLDELYRFHKSKNVNIAEELGDRPWGMSEYVVRENNGHYLCFSAPVSSRQKTSESLPEQVSIVSRTPSIDEYRTLIKSVGWSPSDDDEVVRKTLAAPLYSVIAVADDEPIGCAILLGDGASFYYVKDVVVKPEWQRKHVGAAMMNAIDAWLSDNGVPHAMVALITGEGLIPFYSQFGYGPSFSMQKKVASRTK